MAKSRNCCKYKKWPDVDVKTCHNSWSCWKFATKDLHTFQSPLSTSQLPWDAAGLDILAPNIEATMAVRRGLFIAFRLHHTNTQSFEKMSRKWRKCHFGASINNHRFDKKIITCKNTSFDAWFFFQWHLQSTTRSRILESYIRTKMQTLYSYIFISQLPIAHLTFLLISSVAQLQWCRDDFDPSGRWIYHVYTNIFSHYFSPGHPTVCPKSLSPGPLYPAHIFSGEK